MTVTPSSSSKLPMMPTDAGTSWSDPAVAKAKAVSDIAGRMPASSFRKSVSPAIGIVRKPAWRASELRFFCFRSKPKCTSAQSPPRERASRPAPRRLGDFDQLTAVDLIEEAENVRRARHPGMAAQQRDIALDRLLIVRDAQRLSW